MRKCLLISLLLICQMALAVELVDPTRPSGFNDSGVSDLRAEHALHLTLIRLGPRPLAVIDGIILKPGDRIGSYQLLAVLADRAVLVGTAGRLTLPLITSLNHSSSRRLNTP